MVDAGRIVEAAWARWQLTLGVLGTCLALLAGLVAGGQLTRVDQYALDHLMPALRPGQPETHSYRGLYLPFSSDANWWSKILDTCVYPCSVLISATVIAIVALVLWRDGRPFAGVVWIHAWAVGTAIEVIGKAVITRPDLYGHADGLRLHVGAFDQAFPSGHSVRGVVIASAVVYVSRRLLRPVLIWALLVPPALVVTAAHTPTDVIGGVILGLMVVIVALGVADRTIGVRLSRAR